MALLHVDGFEHYSGTADISSGVYSSTSTAPCRWNGISGGSSFSTTTYRTTQPSVTSKALQLNAISNAYACLKIPSSTELYVGFNFYVTTSLSAGSMFFLTTTANNYNPNNGIKITYQSDGSIGVYNASSGAAYCTTTPAGIQLNNWYYLELKTIFGAAGSVELRIEGMTVCSATGVDTRGGIGGAGYTYATFSAQSGSSNVNYFDDYYLCDGTGSTNNTFRGPCQVYTLMPDSAGSQTDMTPVGAASNWDCVNEQGYDTTTYVKTSTAGHVDYYNVTDLPAGPTTVHGVQVGSWTCKGSYGTRNARNKTKVGASIVTGATSDPLIYLGYRKNEEVLETKPGGGAWTVTDVNNLEIGIESV